MITRTLGEEGDEAFYRVIVPAYASSALSGMGAARQGGRFNRPDQEALYLSQDTETALAEYRQDNPWLRPCMICTFLVNGLRVADLSAGFDSGHWPQLWFDFGVDWRTEWFNKSVEPPTWYTVDDVVVVGLDGILSPYMARPRGTNLVIYLSPGRIRSRFALVAGVRICHDRQRQPVRLSSGQLQWQHPDPKRGMR